MPQREPVTEGTKALSAVGAAVIGQEGADHHAAAGKPAVGQRQEGGCTSRGFVRQEGGIGQARPIVDGDVEEFQATPPAPATVITVNPMAHASKAAQLFDIQVHQLAGAGSLVAADRGRGRTWTPRKTEPPLDMDDGGERHLQIPGNPEGTPAPLSPAGDLPASGAGERSRAVMRATGSVGQASYPVQLVAPPPSSHGGGAEIERGGHIAEPFPGRQPSNHAESPHGGKSR
jgi:hypothetical protein